MDEQIRKEQLAIAAYRSCMYLHNEINIKSSWNTDERTSGSSDGGKLITWPQFGGSRKIGSEEKTMATDATNKQAATFRETTSTVPGEDSGSGRERRRKKPQFSSFALTSGGFYNLCGIP